MGEGKRGKPGSELERLEIFQVLATEYFSMVALFEPDGEPPVHPAEGERRRWLELFRAALLRKFIVRDEHVSLKLVVRALRLCNYSADRHLAEGADGVVALFTPEMVQGRQHVEPGPAPDEEHAPDPGTGGKAGGDSALGPGRDRFEDVLYGRLLHGDADRFHRSAWANDPLRLSAAAASRFDAERALSAALELVRYGLANNLLKSPRTAGGEGGEGGPAGHQGRPFGTSQ